MAVTPTKTLVVQADEDGVPVLAEPVRLVNPDGTPFTGGGAGPAASSVTPASLNGYDAGTGHSKIVKVKADGSGFDFVDDNATPAANSVTHEMLTSNAVTNGNIADGTITAAKLAAGVIPTIPAAPTWATLSGKPAAGTAIADLTAAPTQDDFNKVLAILRTWGVIAAK